VIGTGGSSGLSIFVAIPVRDRRSSPPSSPTVLLPCLAGWALPLTDHGKQYSSEGHGQPVQTADPSWRWTSEGQLPSGAGPDCSGVARV